ncbi:hypothetical protein DTL42_10240 [Bremerella cremea]|uniref:site-specific DNA-methyltransferase (adenine-specific) n=1 Tax=Bremerella cremea TaxID=1031537 RepID=A0A368KRL7_9BACT|nr:type ISP restriction/modification enzyme [Bremerella cremea]RCS50489.1 hypothetical protein DTL42_10240 [Bremerella cremea]
MSISSNAYRYELELARLSPRQRRARGVFYTPWEVATAVVREIDRRLKVDFNLPLGLADSTPWRMWPGYRQLSQEIRPSRPIVRILEPSAGSGIFIVAALNQIYGNLSQGETPTTLNRKWQSFVEEDLPGRFHGVELLPDAIPAARDTIGQFFEATGLAADASQAITLHCGNALEPKIHAEIGSPATVILGNPPYAAASTNTSQWIRQLLRGKVDGQQHYRNYFEADGQPLNERKLWLHDDYVKFLRVSQWHLERAGLGVIGLVTNHGFFDNVTFRGLRFQLLDCFDRIAVLDLNGNSKKRGTSSRLARDESVFDIGQGVALSVLTKSPEVLPKTVRYGELWGGRDRKLKQLAAKSWDELTPQHLTPAPPHYFLVPRGLDVSHEYQQGISVTELIPQSTSTIVTARDAIVIDTDRGRLLARIAEFRDSTIDSGVLRAKYFPRPRSGKYPPGDTRGWQLGQAREALRKDPAWQDRITECSYRPFDRRWIYWSPDMIDWPRGKAMQAMQNPDALALVVRRQMPPDRPCNFFFVTDALTVDGILRSDNRGNETLLPMIIDGQENLQRELLPNYLQETCVRQIFAYLYALFHAAEYRTYFAESLRVDYPRVFFPPTQTTFAKLAQCGESLLTIHLRRPQLPEQQIAAATYSVAAGYPKWQEGDVWVNRQTRLTKVDSAAWLYHIGSHQVLRKWLKDRKHATLSAEEVSNYLGIVAAIGETQSVMQKVDETIKKLGGLHRALGIETAIPAS